MVQHRAFEQFPPDEQVFVHHLDFPMQVCDFLNLCMRVFSILPCARMASDIDWAIDGVSIRNASGNSFPIKCVGFSPSRADADGFASATR